MINNAAVIAKMSEVMDALRLSGDYRQTRPDQYQHINTGILVEPGYVYGELTVTLMTPAKERTQHRMSTAHALAEWDLAQEIRAIESAVLGRHRAPEGELSCCS